MTPPKSLIPNRKNAIRNKAKRKLEKGRLCCYSDKKLKITIKDNGIIRVDEREGRNGDEKDPNEITPYENNQERVLKPSFMIRFLSLSTSKL